ncbi:MAG: response regulator [Ruminococcaceae bacterium]|nr:response regulator [Oscillospiraceae bacterium]
MLYKRLTILIANRDMVFTDSLRKIISNRRDMTTVASTSCGDLVLPLLCEKKPNVLIVDLYLTGANMIECIAKMKSHLQYEPIVVIASECSREVKTILNNTVKNIIYMDPALDYDYMLDIVRDTANIQNMTYVEENGGKYTENMYLMKNITVLLHDMGVPAHLKGHGYLRDAICMAVENPLILSNMQRRVYSEIGRKEGKKPANIEKAIRTAIEVSLLRCNPELLKEFFGYTINSDKGKPTNSEYIAMLADRYSLWLA